MPTTLPDLDNCKRTIDLQCNAVKAKVSAIAFEPSGNIIAASANKNVFGTDELSIHAEDSLVRKLKRLNARTRYKLIYILVARWSSLKGWTIAKPCENCQSIMKNYGVDGVFYTDHDGTIKVLW